MTTRDIVGVKAVSAPFQRRFSKTKGPEDENEPGNVITNSYDPFMGTRGSPGFCELSIRSAACRRGH